MFILCDDSGAFDIRENDANSIRYALWAAVLLDYEGRRWWSKRHKKLQGKGKDLEKKEASQLLKEIHDMGITACAHCVDLNQNLVKVADRQNQLLNPLKSFSDTQPEHLRESLLKHLACLEQMKPSTFVKTWTLQEVIIECLYSWCQTLKERRTQDQRNLTLIVDDVVKPAVPICKHFIYFMCERRSHEGRFHFPDNVPKKLEKYTFELNGNTYFNLTDLLKVLPGDRPHMDDLHMELKLADVIANLTRRAIKGDLAIETTKLLANIAQVKLVHFDPDSSEREVRVPEHALANHHALGLTSF